MPLRHVLAKLNSSFKISTISPLKIIPFMLVQIVCASSLNPVKISVPIWKIIDSVKSIKIEDLFNFKLEQCAWELAKSFPVVKVLGWKELIRWIKVGGSAVTLQRWVMTETNSWRMWSTVTGLLVREFLSVRQPPVRAFYVKIYSHHIFSWKCSVMQ